MIIKQPELIEKCDGLVRVQCPVETREGERLLWYELNARYKDYLTLDRLDAFVVGLILYAMKINEEIVVDGPISNKLAHNLKYYMHVMKMFYPDLHVVPLRISKKEKPSSYPKGSGVGTSLSNGVDSYCTLWEHFKNCDSDRNRITHVFHVYAGQKGYGTLDGKSKFRNNLPRIKETAKRLNLELIVVESNQETFYEPGQSFFDTFGPRILSCVLLLQKLISIYYFPSSSKYEDFFAEGSTPLGDPLLSTDELDIVSDGAQYSRIEKTKIISDWEMTHSFLTVCHGIQSPEKFNCSVCEKCVRTMITLDILGLRKKYKQVFDFTDFERNKNLYLCNISLSALAGDQVYSSFLKEMKTYTRNNGYPLKIKPGMMVLAIWFKLKNPYSVKKLLKSWGFK